MAPPFIAYFGAFEQGGGKNALLQIAYDQCRLYRQYLQDSTTKLWKHIVIGTSADPRFWATGNGWAAAGMFRVLQTIRNSDVSDSFITQQQDLANWIEEIVKAAWTYQVHCPFYSITSLQLQIADDCPPRPLMAPSTMLSTTPARSQTPLRPLYSPLSPTA